MGSNDPAAAYAAYGYGENYAEAGDAYNPYGWPGFTQPTNQHTRPPQARKNQYRPAPYQNQYGQRPDQKVGLGGPGEWVTPSQAAAGRGFPSKRGNYGGFKGAPRQPKEQVTAGKTPAMVLHETFKNVDEKFEEIEDTPKRYRCIFIVEGQAFSMEAQNKKTAKQKAAELVVRSLRPDIQMTPYADGVMTMPVTAAKRQPGFQHTADQSDVSNGQGDKSNGQQAKKMKLSAFESALSLTDFLMKLCQQTQPFNVYKPVFEFNDVADPNASDSSKKLFSVKLKFAEQNKEYTKVGMTKMASKEFVIREALQELFNVSNANIREVVRRQIMSKLKMEESILQMLHHVCDVGNCKFEFTFDTAENIPLGSGPTPYIASCKLTDEAQNDKVTTYKSQPQPSKHLAKEQAALAILSKYFGIDTAAIGKGKLADGQVAESPRGQQPAGGPCQYLNVMLVKVKKLKGTTSVKYEFTDVNTKPADGNFRCECVIDDKRYAGAGRSKKLAKNNAAIVAIKEIFEVDYVENMTMPMSDRKERERSDFGTRFPQDRVSPLCISVVEFVKREYFLLCNKEGGVKPSTQFAAFVLVNDKDEKRIVAIGSSPQTVLGVEALQHARGTSVLHMEPFVLARRAFIRYLMTEIAGVNRAEKENLAVDTILERAPDGLLRLKSSIRLVICGMFAPNCGYSVPESPNKRLSFVTSNSFMHVPNEVQTLADVMQKGLIRVNSSADKVFKWARLGVQGALLTTLMQPILPSCLFFASKPPVCDESMVFALFARVGPPHIPSIVEAENLFIELHPSDTHVWSRGWENFEVLDHSTGRTFKGPPSRVCKAELFEAYRKLNGATTNVKTYEEAKKVASKYQAEKQILYQQLVEQGWGKWQSKPVELVDFNVDLDGCAF